MTAALLVEAAELVAARTTISPSALQRKLRVGFVKAAQLMEALEDHGLISTPDRGVSAVLVTPDQLPAALDKIRSGELET